MLARRRSRDARLRASADRAAKPMVNGFGRRFANVCCEGCAFLNGSICERMEKSERQETDKEKKNKKLPREGKRKQHTAGSFFGKVSGRDNSHS